MDRGKLSEMILARLNEEKNSLKKQYNQSENKIGFFYIDNLLPKEIVNEINNQFPKEEEMVLNKSIRENKYIAAQMSKYHPILEEIIYAFQNKEVVNCIKDICSIKDLQPDEYLYAGGISSMKKNQFLNPHLDNSHDKDRNRWRVLNLLYYVTPNWHEDNGGNLELWPDGMKGKQITIHSKFNRLVVMATHYSSWHSVSPVLADASRNCVSNYYFSSKPLKTNDEFHVTTFRGRPDQIIKNQVLKVDSFLRMKIRKLFKKGIRENPHQYKK